MFYSDYAETPGTSKTTNALTIVSCKRSLPATQMTMNKVYNTKHEQQSKLALKKVTVSLDVLMQVLWYYLVVEIAMKRIGASL